MRPSEERGETRRAEGRWLRSLVCCSTGLLAFTLAQGCGSQEDRVPVYRLQGKVKVEGEAPVGAFVVLHPKTVPDVKFEVPRSRAVVQSDGSFHVTTYENGDGAPAGDYCLTIEWRPLVKQDGEMRAGPNVLPVEYSQAASSPLSVTVGPAPRDLDPIELTRARSGKRKAALGRGGYD